ncbi:hypothetical protein EDD76_10562 [Kineothrix alysoides]|uniref:Deacetylase PdaC domain-containing protein n=1 Tax=Kineothrix alysoides TaxID=1469948 RepID=A0A4R1R0S4_9FIRM|nr:hypothetical protein [Kineothrix alysoides]TCL58892.1 hypothetical protein EDD76_10562 [Kineothrix alysoides]
MKKQKTLLLMTLALALSFTVSLTAQASPQKMKDGTMFDPEYYARTYPDVIEVFGTETDKLYQHYVEYGKNEGRKATADSKAVEVNAEAEKAIAKMRKLYPHGSTWDGTIRIPVTYSSFTVDGIKTEGSLTYELAWRRALIHLMSKEIYGEKETYPLISSIDVNNIEPYSWITTGVDYENGAWLKEKKVVVPDDEIFVLSVDYENRTFTGLVIRGWTITWDVPYSFDEVKTVLSYQ